MDFNDLVGPNPLVAGNIAANSESYDIFFANRSVGSVENILDTSLETLFRFVLNVRHTGAKINFIQKLPRKNMNFVKNETFKM